MIQSTQRANDLHRNGQVSSDNHLSLLKTANHPTDSVDTQRGNASLPVAHDRAAATGSSQATLEHQQAVVNRLQATLTEARDAVAQVVHNPSAATTTAGNRDHNPAVTGAQHTIMRAPEAQKPQPSHESTGAGAHGSGNGGAGAAEAAKAAAPVNQVMSQAQAEAIVVDIYSQAFPGVEFSRNDLSQVIAQLQTGMMTPDEVRSQVAEGAGLINNTAGDVAGAMERAPGRHPNRQSTIAQELRLSRLAKLMEAGIIPEGKFTINGNFSYNQGAPIPKDQFTENMADLQARLAPKGPAMLGRDLAKSIERFHTDVNKQDVSQEGNDGQGDVRINRSRPGGKIARGINPQIDLTHGTQPLIKGGKADAPPISTSGSTGQPANGGFSVNKASLSDLSDLSDSMNDRSSENNTEPPPPPPPSHDPIALDLNHDGHIGTSGTSTAKDHADKHASVAYDVDGDGRKDRTEWMKGDGDGLLIDDHDGAMSKIAAYRGDVDSNRLFGDEAGKYANGYEKLANFDTNHDGKINGHELDALKVWVDDGDSRLEEGELKTLAELGVTELNVTMALKQNEKGETLMQSTFTQNGQTHMSEDVWFGMDGKAQTGERGFLDSMKQSLTMSTAETAGKMLRRLDAAIVEIQDLNHDIDDRRTHAVLDTSAHQRLHQMSLGGMRI